MLLTLLSGLSACGTTEAEDSGPEPGTAACLSGSSLSTLAAHVRALDLVARVSPSQAAGDMAVGFYQLPGVDVATGLGFHLPSPCDGAYTLDHTCIDEVCYETECTGVGASWLEHVADQGAGTTETDFDGWRVDRGRIQIAWTEGNPALDVVFDVRSLLGPDGTDWGFGGTARLDGTLLLHEEFANIDSEGIVDLDVSDSVIGTITRRDLTLATWDGSQFVSTGDCEPS